jgi:hypothetical protein
MRAMCGLSRAAFSRLLELVSPSLAALTTHGTERVRRVPCVLSDKEQLFLTLLWCRRYYTQLELQVHVDIDPWCVGCDFFFNFFCLHIFVQCAWFVVSSACGDARAVQSLSFCSTLMVLCC